MELQRKEFYEKHLKVKASQLNDSDFCFHHHSISNGVKTTTFKQTPLTSTYLIAFIVSDFQSKDTAAADQKIPQRVFANPNLVNQADYALSEGVTILDAIAKYVQVN